MKRFLPILLLLSLNGLVLACPMCKDSVPTSDASSAGGVPVGFNLSVYILLGTFFAVLGLVICGVTHAVHTTPVLPRQFSRGFPIKASQNSPTSSAPPAGSSQDETELP